MRRHNEFEPSRIAKLIGAPFRFCRTWWNRLNDDSIHADRSPFQMGVAVVTFPFRLLYGFAVFMIFAWSTSRNSFAFMRGLPALLVMGGFWTVVWLSFFVVSRKAQVSRTRGYINLHTTTSPEFPEYAEIFNVRLVSLLPDDEEAKFQLALNMERLEEHLQARQIFEFLAPLEDANRNGILDPGEDQNDDGLITSGYPNAHVRLAQLFRMGDHMGVSEEEGMQLARQHYDLALQTEENNLLALIGNAEICSKTGQMEDSAKYLEQLLKGRIVSLVQLTALPELLKIRKELGQQEAADSMARSAIAKIKEVARNNPERFEIWLSLIQCAAFLKDYEEAANIIRLGQELSKSPEVQGKLRTLSSNVWVTKADDFPDMNNQRQFKIRLGALCRGAASNSANIEIFRRLLPFSAPENPEQEFWLRDALIDSKFPETVHALLGVFQISQGEFSQAQEHWKIAHQQSPRTTAVIINNLIEVAMEDEESTVANLGEMLAVANELFPKDIRLQITQGIYFSRNGRSEEAIKLLEDALEAAPGYYNARQALINCYLETGDKGQASYHQDALDNALRQLSENERKRVETYLETRN